MIKSVSTIDMPDHFLILLNFGTQKRYCYLQRKLEKGYLNEPLEVALMCKSGPCGKLQTQNITYICLAFSFPYRLKYRKQSSRLHEGKC